jgi:hypothetical protein
MTRSVCYRNSGRTGDGPGRPPTRLVLFPEFYYELRQSMERQQLSLFLILPGLSREVLLIAYP